MEKKIKKYISSTVSYHDIYKAVEIANELNLGLEISRFGKLKDLDEKFNETLDEYEDAIKDLEGPLSLHGFFSNLCPVSKDPLIKEASIKRYYQSLEIASRLGADKVVFHTCFNNLLKQQVYRDNFFHSTVEFYSEFVSYFEERKITLLIENVHEPDSSMIRNIIGAVNSPYLKATIDIGHCNIHSKNSVSDWIKDYGIMLYHMHFHNNFKDEDSHSSLKQGTLNIKEIIQTLKDLRLYPSVTFEIFDKDALAESVQYLDEILDELKFGI